MYINLNMHILHRLPVLNTFYLYQERAKQIQSFMLLCLVFPLNLLNQVLVFTKLSGIHTKFVFSPSLLNTSTWGHIHVFSDL